MRIWMVRRKIVAAVSISIVICIIVIGNSLAQDIISLDATTKQLERRGISGDAGAYLQLGDLYLRSGAVAKGGLQAVRYYKQAATMGSVVAFSRLGELYRRGSDDVPRDLEQAVIFLRSAVDAGDANSKKSLGEILLEGPSSASSYQEGLRLLKEAADAGDAYAAISLAGFYTRGQGVPADGKMALSLLEPLASQGNASALTGLGELFRSGVTGVTIDLEKARDLLSRAAEKGDITGKKRLADMIFKGEGGPQDIEAAVTMLTSVGDAGAYLQLGDLYLRSGAVAKGGLQAVRYYKQAATMGSVVAFSRLGELYRRGSDDVPRDLEQAVIFLRSAVDAGDANSKKSLGEILLEGPSSASSYQEGLRLLKEAADAGDAYAAISLAGFYTRGQGVPADGKMALSLLEPLASQGNASALTGLGELFRSGVTGVTIDLEKARDLLSRAAEKGDITGKKRLADMIFKGEGGPQDIEAAVTMLTSVGDAGAYLQLGDLYLRSGAVAKGGLQAVRYYKQAATMGSVVAFSRLGELYRRGSDDVPRDLEQAVIFLRSAVDAGDANSKKSLGEILLEGPSSASSYQEGLRLLKEAADAGDAYAAISLAGFYTRGQGVPADGKMALSLLEPLASQGNASALTGLGELFRSGVTGVTIDLEKARDLLSRAAEKGDITGKKRLADMIFKGEGGPQDIEAAVTMLTSVGDAGAYLQLGDLYLRSGAVAKGGLQAVRYYKQAATMGSVVAFSRLGELYRRGSDDVPRDLEQAVIFLRSAVDAGDANSKKSLGETLLEGPSSASSYQEGLRLLKEAADAGDAYAQVRFATEILNTSSTVEDASAALNILHAAVTNKTPGAAVELAKLQLLRRISGATVTDALNILRQASDLGDRSAANYLMYVLRDGIYGVVESDVVSAKRDLEKYREVIGEENYIVDKFLLSLKLSSKIKSLESLFVEYRNIDPGKRGEILKSARYIDPNFYTYALQKELAELGLYAGKATGQLDRKTISAIDAACESAVVHAECYYGPLSKQVAQALSGLISIQK